MGVWRRVSYPAAERERETPGGELYGRQSSDDRDHTGLFSIPGKATEKVKELFKVAVHPLAKLNVQQTGCCYEMNPDRVM